MTRRNLILVLATITALSGLALSAARARDVPKVATGFVANILCSETFVSGQSPERVFAETTAAMPGAGLITWAMGYKVDRARRDVTVTLFGFGKSHAVYREGFGCYLDHGDAVTEASPLAEELRRAQVLLPDIAGAAVVAPASPQLAARARSRLRRARAASAAPHQGGGGREGRPCRRRALCGWLRHRYPDPRLLRDQVRHFGADRHSGAKGRAFAQRSCADRSVEARWRSAGINNGRSSPAPHRGAGARQFAAGLARPRCWSRSTG